MSPKQNMPAFDIFSVAPLPDYSIEQALQKRGVLTIAGTDEAGRGPLAGPVVAAAVILDPKAIPPGLNDSKKLTEKKRELLFDQILKYADVSISTGSIGEIERVNIRAASLNAMVRSCHGLTTYPDHVLVDGKDVPFALTAIGSALIKGDAKSLSIAAASVIAKVVRDRIMIRADDIYPQYGFARHKGYGTKIHMEALEKFGPCPLHRKTFSPISEMLA